MAKYYAVKEGRLPGIYTSWPETQKQTHGYQGAVFKSFSSKADAERYLGINPNPFERHGAPADPLPSTTAPVDLDAHLAPDAAILYTDGSFNQPDNLYGYGYTITHNNAKSTGYGGGDNAELVTMRQVAGELLAAMYGLQEALALDTSQIVIRYDYKGVEQWATGGWQANKVGTQRYRKIMLDLISRFNGDVIFQKVKAHSDEAGNEEADQLAKKGAGLV